MGHLLNFSETIVFCNKCTYYRLFKLFNQSMCSEKLDMMKKANLKKIRLHVCLQYLKYTDQIKSHHCCNKIMLHGIHHLGITVQLSPLLICEYILYSHYTHIIVQKYLNSFWNCPTNFTYNHFNSTADSICWPGHFYLTAHF